MKSIWYLCACAAVLATFASSTAVAVNLAGSARITNYEGQWIYRDRPPGPDTSGTHYGFYSDIGSTNSNTSSMVASVRKKNTGLPPSTDPSQNCLYFSLSGPAEYGDYAGSYSDWRLGTQNYYHVKFDWITNFTSGGENLRLDISYYNAPGSFWSVTPGAGYHTGHVDMDIAAPDIWDIYFRVSVVPEPSSLFALLSCVGGLGGLIWRRQR